MPEAALVYQCMLAWETNSPKGQIWKAAYHNGRALLNVSAALRRMAEK